MELIWKKRKKTNPKQQTKKKTKQPTPPKYLLLKKPIPHFHSLLSKTEEQIKAQQHNLQLALAGSELCTVHTQNSTRKEEALDQKIPIFLHWGSIHEYILC